SETGLDRRRAVGDPGHELAGESARGGQRLAFRVGPGHAAHGQGRVGRRGDESDVVPLQGGVRANGGCDDLPGVAFLDARLRDAVAADGRLAGVGAGVGVDGVAVVALLGRLDEPVSTAGDRAGVGAGVGVDGVAVVARLGSLHEPVATAGDRAGVGAGVGVDGVRVIALLGPLHEPVSAAGGHAGVGAGVGVRGVAVVASLDPLLDEAVAATSGLAGVETAV